MATLAAGSNTSVFVGYGQTVTLTTTHNVSGRWYFISQNTEIVGPGGMGHQFGPVPTNDVLGPFAYPGTLYIENFPGSAAVVTYTVNLGTAYPGNFSTIAASSTISGPVSATTLAASSTVSGTGFTNYLAAPPSIGTTTPGIVKTSNLQAAYTDSTGTPGNVTNNSPRGRVALAAGASTIVVTNSLVTATSMIVAMVRAVDGAATDIVTATAAAGSFTITMNAATTGTACQIDFLVVN